MIWSSMLDIYLQITLWCHSVSHFWLGNQIKVCQVTWGRRMVCWILINHHELHCSCYLGFVLCEVNSLVLWSQLVLFHGAICFEKNLCGFHMIQTNSTTEERNVLWKIFFSLVFSCHFISRNCLLFFPFNIFNLSSYFNQHHLAKFQAIIVNFNS